MLRAWHIRVYQACWLEADLDMLQWNCQVMCGHAALFTIQAHRES